MNKTMKPWLLAIVLLLILTTQVLFLSCSASSTYSADAIEGRVVDVLTGRPIEGVVVTANWQLDEGTFGGSVEIGQLVVLEVVTDKSGRYRFPSWGPKSVSRGHLAHNAPTLLFFKDGYEYLRLVNQIIVSSKNNHRVSQWSGKVILLRPFSAGRRNYPAYLASAYRRELRFVFEEGWWRSVPCLLSALQRTAIDLGYESLTKLMHVPSHAERNEIEEYLRIGKLCVSHP